MSLFPEMCLPSSLVSVAAARRNTTTTLHSEEILNNIHTGLSFVLSVSRWQGSLHTRYRTSYKRSTRSPIVGVPPRKFHTKASWHLSTSREFVRGRYPHEEQAHTDTPHANLQALQSQKPTFLTRPVCSQCQTRTLSLTEDLQNLFTLWRASW